MMNNKCDPYIIRFNPRMTELHKNGQKCCTTRRHIIGRFGDIFEDENIPGQMFRIIAGSIMPLKYVRDLFYTSEGFQTPEAFEAFWVEMYGSFDGEMKVFVHWYAPILKEEPDARI